MSTEAGPPPFSPSADGEVPQREVARDDTLVKALHLLVHLVANAAVKVGPTVAVDCVTVGADELPVGIIELLELRVGVLQFIFHPHTV